MNGARWVRRFAFAGAAGFAVWAVVPGAGANAAAAPPQTFSAIAGASGVEYNFDRKPGLAPVGNLIHGATPYATSTLADATSQAQATFVYLGAFQTLPDLICTAAVDEAGKSYCANFDNPATGTFPPDYPLDASAKYPDHQTDDATFSSQNRTVGGGGAPLTAKVGRIHAEAKALSAGADSRSSSTKFLAGLINTGSSTTTTSQRIDKAGAVVSTADSLVSDISLVKLVHIDSVHSKTTVIYDGVHKPKVTASTTVSGASALGIPLRLDGDGLHVASNHNKQVLKILNEQLNFLLNGNYTKISVAGATNTVGDHSVHPVAGGVTVSYDNTVAGAPKPPTLPAEIPYCSKIIEEIRKSQLGLVFDPLFAGVPVNFCAPPTPLNPNGRYYGTMTIANAGTLVSAASFSLGGDPGSGFDGTTTPGSGPSTTFVPGTTGTSGTPGTSGVPGSDGAGDQEVSPQLADNNAVGYLEDFGNAAQRLKYLFPAFLLAVLGFLAGRVGRAPARLPNGVT